MPDGSEKIEFNKITLDNITDSMESKDYTKYCFLPVNFPLLKKYYDQQMSVFWVPKEIDYAEDRFEWEKLDPNTKMFIEFVLALFAQLDGIVSENLHTFKEATSDIKECGWFYSMQDLIENVHNETYSNLIETYIRDPEKKSRAFNSIQNYPSIKAIADWCFSWMNSSLPFTERCIAFACNRKCFEGVVFIYQRFQGLQGFKTILHHIQ